MPIIKPKTILKKKSLYNHTALQKTLKDAIKEVTSHEKEILNSLTPAEEQFYLKAKDKDYLIIRGGWPDFMIIKDNKISFVEVKDKDDKLTTKQKIMLKILAGLNFPCFIWNPNKGFKPFK